MDAVEDLPPHLISASDREVVLPLAEATEALEFLTSRGWRFLGWEGWVRHRDGRLSHSARFQGTASLEGTSADVDFGRVTMQADQAAWNHEPEVPGGHLLFCVTFAEPTNR